MFAVTDKVRVVAASVDVVLRVDAFAGGESGVGWRDGRLKSAKPSNAPETETRLSAPVRAS